MMERVIFISSLFRTRKDLNKEVRQRKEERSNGTIPFPFGKGDKLQKYGGHLDHKILSEYPVEYKSQPRAFKETLAFHQFIHLEEERRPCGQGRIRDAKKRKDYALPILTKKKTRRTVDTWIIRF